MINAGHPYINASGFVIEFFVENSSLTYISCHTKKYRLKHISRHYARYFKNNIDVSYPCA